MRKPLPLALLGAVLLASLTACSSSVAAGDVEQQITDKLGGQVGGIQGVSCPGDLPGEVGSKITCTMTTAGGAERPVHVTVTSVDGEQINFDMEAPAAG